MLIQLIIIAFMMGHNISPAQENDVINNLKSKSFEVVFNPEILRIPNIAKNIVILDEIIKPFENLIEELNCSHHINPKNLNLLQGIFEAQLMDSLKERWIRPEFECQSKSLADIDLNPVHILFCTK